MMGAMTATPLPVTAATRPAAAALGTLVHERDTGRVLRWTGREWVDDLPGWLSAQFDEAERLARAATPGPWLVAESGEVESVATFGTPGYEQRFAITRDSEGLSASIGEADAAYVANLGPSWRRADIARKRAILADHSVTDGWDGENLDGRICERCCSEDLSGGREGEPYPCWTVRLLAAEFEDGPGWSAEWALPNPKTSAGELS
jgi:hypothetical protein